MFARRSLKREIQWWISSKPSIISQLKTKQRIAPLAPSASNQRRLIATQKMTPQASHQILVEQRKNRPVAPHLSIYKYQMSSTLSALHRITGIMLSAGFYIFGTAYLVSPILGWHLDSASMAAAFGALPTLAKVAAKFAVAMPFTYHSFNGLRYLVWDMGAQIKNSQIIKTGWVVTVLSTVSAMVLATLY